MVCFGKLSLSVIPIGNNQAASSRASAVAKIPSKLRGRRRILGPIFFEETIKTAAYMEIFNTFVNQLDDEKLSIVYFQQDGATSHTSHASMAEIQSFFGDRVISKGLWPPRSPDLTPPDYLLWG